ncbi:uncharacterized protein LOC114515803 isoform X4 [Dendronephthya gigantea]|uniref:uncharacterized protein LOC114515803 isoform X4 n=1 Tax=Dendronephthya gigantea TaxID=151771 RepID=UPI00106BABE0|nr:uncharacterized protein LOC114515803 isoform X4 [Dendronephthya gigantea]
MEITVYKAALFTCFLAVITAVSANTNYAGSCVTPIDVAFLMDSSGSLGTTNYKRLKDTVGIMGKYFGVSPMGSHAAIILYSDNSLISARLDQFSTQAQFQTKVNRLRYLSQRSRMDASLTAAHSRIFTQAGNARDYLPKVAILFTDGQQTRFRDRVPLPDAAKRLRERGVEIFVIGVGNGPSTNEMESMVVDKKNHVMRIRSFRILKEQSESIAERVCQLFGARKQDVSPYPMDIGFMIHIPPSYRRREQNKAKQFIASVATTLGVELPNSRAAFLQYNETVGPVITFSEFSGLKKFYDDLSYLSKNGEMSKIAVAISEASKRIFSTDSRLAVSRVAVLLKFGQADDIQEAEVAAAQLRLKGVKLFVVHVGDAREMDSIRNLVSDAENLFHANDVAGLANVVIPIHNKIISESVPTAKELSSLPVSYSSIQVKWIPAFDPKNVISGYELTWKVVEDDKGRNVINSPLRSSGVLPVDASKYDIKNLTPYTLYKIYLQPQWAPGVRGDIPETQSRTLEDIDECLNDPCDDNAKCTNTKRSFTCECNTGYTGDGFTCRDIDECEGSPCDANGKCSNNPGSFECSCNTGYAGNGFTCSDIDECQGSPCDVNGKCSNNAGSFECECKIGYYGNGFTCDDINECLRNPCDINAACSNNDGSYSCACKTGYSGDGFFCADNNECNNRPCNENAKCQNSAGSFSCSCNIGYLGDGFTCEDVNECNNEVPPCDENAKCFNNEGSYYCECNAGYNGNGKICAAVNICSYPMDLAIAIDTSDSITHSDFEIQKSAVIMLARSFGLSDSKTHVAVIVYGSESRVAINLSDHVDLESFANAVRSIKYEGGQTRIDLALAIASNSVFTPSGGARVGMPKMLIIMTDGQQTSAPDAIELSDAVAPLASIGIHIVSIGIGHEVDEYELMAISESRKNIYHVKTFDTLFDTVTVVGQSLCQKAQKDCKRHADIVLLVDSSASMRGGNYLKQKTLLKAIGREFDVSMYGSHVGIVLYNSEAEVITGFNNKTTLKSFENIVDNLPLKGGKIRLDKALRLAASDVLTKEKGMRSENIPKILFILTDGTQNKKCDEEALELAIAPLRNEGVHVIAIGVGEAEKNELRPLVKTQRDLFIGDDFEEVTEPVLDLIKVLCKETEQLCNLGSQYVDINVDGCINEYPVEVVVCDGKCSSGTRYINEAPFYEGRCSCCFPSVLNSKDVILKCPNDTTKRHRITVPAACACRSCGNTAAAPPIENKENEAKIDTPGI